MARFERRRRRDDRADHEPDPWLDDPVPAAPDDPPVVPAPRDARADGAPATRAARPAVWRRPEPEPVDVVDEPVTDPFGFPPVPPVVAAAPVTPEPVPTWAAWVPAAPDVRPRGDGREPAPADPTDRNDAWDPDPRPGTDHGRSGDAPGTTDRAAGHGRAAGTGRARGRGEAAAPTDTLRSRPGAGSAPVAVPAHPGERGPTSGFAPSGARAGDVPSDSPPEPEPSDRRDDSPGPTVVAPPAAPTRGPTSGAPASQPGPDPAEAGALAGAFAADYLSWDEDDPARRGRALADHLPAPAADRALLGWSGRGRQRAEIVLPGTVRRDDEGRLLVDVRVRVTPYRRVSRSDPAPDPEPGETLGAVASAPPVTARGWRGLAARWVRLVVTVARDGDRLVVDAGEEPIGAETIGAGTPDEHDAPARPIAEDPTLDGDETGVAAGSGR